MFGTSAYLNDFIPNLCSSVGLLEFTTIFINNRKINERYGNYGIVEFINVVIIFFSYGYIRVYYLGKLC